MKANEYMLMVQCVEEGVKYGWNRAYKHTDMPSEEQIHKEIIDAVTLAISEWFMFGDNKE
jgi:hypothetical protein